MRYRRCSQCNEMRPLNVDNFRRAGNTSRFQGVCKTCKPITIQETARNASQKIKDSFRKR